ncbi:MAG: S-adenosylmethionine decarboxylase [Deltaproteobacteria bacterium]|nr:S-adenosylmethionine decarboxylase [Deltaproteobacteria bacterium]
MTTSQAIHTSLDLYECNPEIIRNADEIKRYVIELCDLIELRRIGECQVVHFGEEQRVAGYSMVQLIETSLISGHFANLTNTAYIDIFSFKSYDSGQVIRFSREFFHADSVRSQVTTRMGSQPRRKAFQTLTVLQGRRKTNPGNS